MGILFSLCKKRISITNIYKLDNIEKLSSGPFCEVSKGFSKKNNKFITIKTLKRLNDKTCMNEIAILKKLDHPNIVKYIESYNDNYYYYIIMDYYSGDELFKYRERVSIINEQVVKNIMLQLFDAVNYLHNQVKICHRDLKLENIIFEDETHQTIKLIDFGLSKPINKNQLFIDKVGTVYYIAPEILKTGKYDYKCDIWSLGVILYILIFNTPPFYSQSDNEILTLIQKGNYTVYNNKVSTDVINLIKNM